MVNSFEHAFITRFAHNPVPINDLISISKLLGAPRQMNLTPSKIWVVMLVSMSLETFVLVRFMCLSYEEFAELTMFGSLNEFRQVFMALENGKAMRTASIPAWVSPMFGGVLRCQLPDGGVQP